MKANKINYEVYLEAKVKSIKCQNSTTLRGFASIYLKPTAQDDIDQFVRPFYKCKTLINIYNAGMKITLKTPTQPDTDGKWSPALGGVAVTYVCPKPKPKPPPKPTTTSTVTTPTGSPTTEASLSSTGKTTEEPSNATEKVTDCKMASWMIILLAIAGAVGLFLMLLACCCVSYISLPCLQRYKSSYD